jgi:large subunit ribosomal protein L29
MKAEELRNLSLEELESELHRLKEELFTLRCRDRKINPLENPVKIRLIKKDIARILTIKNEKLKNEKKIKR